MNFSFLISSLNRLLGIPVMSSPVSLLNEMHTFLIVARSSVSILHVMSTTSLVVNAAV